MTLHGVRSSIFARRVHLRSHGATVPSIREAGRASSSGRADGTSWLSARPNSYDTARRPSLNGHARRAANGDRSNTLVTSGGGCFPGLGIGLVWLNDLLPEGADRLHDLFVVQIRQLHVQDELVGARLLVGIDDLAHLIWRSDGHRAQFEQAVGGIGRLEVDLGTVLVVITVRFRYRAKLSLPG